LLFGTNESRRAPQREDSDAQEARTGMIDLIERYADHRFFSGQSSSANCTDRSRSGPERAVTTSDHG
jgi:hypothetical protein